MSSDVPAGAFCYLERPLQPALQQLTPEERAILDAINSRVAAAESLPHLLDFVFEQAKRVMPTNRISLAFLEDGGRRLVAKDTRTDYDEVHLQAGYSESLTGTSLQHVIDGGHPRIIGDLQQYLDFHPGSRSTRLILREGIRSSMTCPLIVDQRIVGVLFHSSRQPRAFTQRHLVMHQAMIDRLAQAIEKAYRIEQLTAANRAYSEMLAFISHELKNPVAAMVMHSRLLRDGYLGEVNPQQTDILQRMINKGEYLLSLVREYLDLSRIESQQLRLNPQSDVDLLGEVILPALEIIDTELHAKEMTLLRVWPEQIGPVECDPMLLKIVIINLLSNAVRYGRQQGQIRVTILPHEHRLRVIVWNEGNGFRSSDRHKLFRRFSRLDNQDSARQKGTGVGLYSCWRIVELHRGKIRAQSEFGKWAEFSFHIPQPLPKDDPSQPPPQEMPSSQ